MPSIDPPIKATPPNFNNTLVKICFMDLRLLAHGQLGHVHYIPIIMVILKMEWKLKSKEEHYFLHLNYE